MRWPWQKRPEPQFVIEFYPASRNYAVTYGDGYLWREAFTGIIRYEDYKPWRKLSGAFVRTEGEARHMIEQFKQHALGLGVKRIPE